MEKEILSNVHDFKTSDIKLKGFKVYEVESGVNAVPNYSRRDFYKICINLGENLIHYADRGIETHGPILFFGTPHIPYSWEVISANYNGYACAFTEEFLKVNERSESLQESPLFKIGGNPVFELNEEQKNFIITIFKKMLVEQKTAYIFKDELIRNYLNIIIHEALKMQPSENYFKHKNASSRITSLFLELLERQFPIESLDKPLRLKTAQDFAGSLALHPNHLNKAVKEITGRSTSSHIADRIIMEAKALLQHTSWSVSEVGYALGFEYQTYFNNYFKKLTGTVPMSLRPKNF